METIRGISYRHRNERPPRLSSCLSERLVYGGIEIKCVYHPRRGGEAKIAFSTATMKLLTEVCHQTDVARNPFVEIISLDISLAFATRNAAAAEEGEGEGEGEGHGTTKNG